jgi:hypothetical protein
MMREAEAHAEEDRARREEAETRNQGDSLLFGTEKFLKDNEDKISSEDKAETEAALGELKTALNGDTAAIRTAMDKVRPPRKRWEPQLRLPSSRVPTGRRLGLRVLAKPSRAPARTTWSRPRLSRRSPAPPPPSSSPRQGQGAAGALPPPGCAIHPDFSQGVWQ